MGILSNLANLGVNAPRIEAQEKPRVLREFGYSTLNTIFAPIGRSSAMSIPAAAACRNLIVNAVAQTPLELYRKSTGEELGKPIWLDQPSVSQPRIVTMSLLVDSLLWYGVGYLEVTEQYADDGRPSRFQFVDFGRVSYTTNYNTTIIDKYYVDGIERPMSGLGSLVTFQMTNEGILNYGSEVLQQALAIERAASVAASTPMASGVLKNTGADLDPKEVQELLAEWKSARNTRSTAYLTSTLEWQPVNFSNKDQQMVESQSNMATQVARLFGVPAYYLSADQNASMTYSNLIDQNKFFVQHTLQPFFSAIEERFSMNDITANGNIVKFDLDSSILRPDPIKRLEVTEKMLTLGLIDLARAQEMNDLTPNGNTNGITEIQ